MIIIPPLTMCSTALSSSWVTLQHRTHKAQFHMCNTLTVHQTQRPRLS